ncbi:MAG: hypothetical protein E6K24_03345 [Gammaproteobacteria bacterium]|nr:MAG: hypothetical protein E6K24_03345 [Gammaproteobacteria bacterium]
MKTKAAVAYAAGKQLEVVAVDLDGPKAGEVLIEIRASGVCHTVKFTRSGAAPEGLFPVIFGHAGHGVRRCAGPQRRSDARGRVGPLGDHLLRTLRAFGVRGALL